MKRVDTAGNRPRRVTRGVLMAAALFVAPGVWPLPATAREQAAPVATADPEATAAKAGTAATVPHVPLGILLERLPNKQDVRTYQTLRESARGAGGRSGAWRFVRGREVRYLSPQEALGQALDKNLTLSRSRLDADKARDAIDQAKAVFDPVFNLSIGNKISHRYDRKIDGRVFYKQLNESVVEHDPGDPTAGAVKLYKDRDYSANPDPNFSAVGPFTNEIVFGARDQADLREEITVSTKKLGTNENSPSITGTGSLTISQLLPWGPAITLTEVTTRKRTFHDELGKYWQAPWGSSWSASLYIPLPFTKNFGPHASADVAVKKAKIARDSRDWQVMADVNDILAQVDLTYWNLVQSLQQLQVTIENRRASEEQYQSTLRLFDLGRVTRLGKEQMEAERARTRVQEEMQWNAVLNASHALAILTENDEERMGSYLLLPAGFQERLGTALPVDAKQTTTVGLAIAAGLENNRVLKVSDSAVETSELEYAYRRNQARPDLSVSLGVSESQDNSIFGHKNLGQSLGQLANPDSRSTSAAVNYNYPVRKRHVRAGVDLAKASLEMSRLNRQALADSIAKRISDALADLFSSRKRHEKARRTEKMAAASLENAQQRWKVKGDISEMELVLKRRDLLTARLNAVTAAVDVKKAETALLAAQGTLPEILPVSTASSEFDRYRIGKLKESDAVPFFSSLRKRLAEVF